MKLVISTKKDDNMKINPNNPNDFIGKKLKIFLILKI